jgi:hypothetical protein
MIREHVPRGVLAALTLALASSPASAVVEVARQADRFVDSIGVNTHVMFDGSNYAAHFPDWVKPRLVELGVRHVREDQGGCSAAAKARVKDLAAAGMRATLTTSSDPGAALADVRDCTGALDAAGAVVEAVEAANERDGPWWSNAAAWAPWQRKLHDLLVGTGPATWESNFAASVRIFSPPLANAAAAPGTLNGAFPGSTRAARAAAAGSYYEYVNGHFYPAGDYPEGPGGGGYGQAFGASLDVLRANLGPRLPAVVTEFGYKQCDPQPGHPFVTQRAAAKYIPRYLFQAFGRNVRYAYLYALLDGPGGGSAAECFGLVDGLGAPKQAFTALKGTIALLEDPGAAFAPGSLDYQIAGAATNVRTALLQKRNGVFYLVLWLAVDGSTGGDGRTPAGDLEPAPVALTLVLGKAASAVTIHRPTFGEAPVRVAGASITRVPVSVRDHVTVVEITPRAIPAPSPLRGVLSRTHRLP